MKQINPKLLLITNIVVIILLVLATVFFFVEINMIKTHGGKCISDPMEWAEKHAFDNKEIIIDCSCRQIRSGYVVDVSQLNFTGDEKNG